jgi:NitT/TauT family transport system permease protein
VTFIPGPTHPQSAIRHPQSAPRRLSAQARSRLEFLATTLAVLGLWELSPLLGMPDFILPPPRQIVRKFLQIYPSVFRHSAITLVESVLGFALAFLCGLPLAIGIVHSRFMEKTVYPYVVAVRLIPVISIAPLMVIWFGIGITPKVVVSALVAFFPIVVNSVVGLRSGAAEALKLMRSLKASPRQIFWKIRIYACLPYLFSALRVSATLAVIGAIVGEFVGGSDKGLGAMMVQAQAFLYTDTLFVGVVFSAILGLLLFGAVAVVERRVLFWHESVSESAP